MQHVQIQQQLYQEQQKEKKVDQIQSTQDVSQRKTPSRKRRRPPHSYASLIAQAILTSRNQKLSLRDIYDWIQAKYPHLYEANETGWQNTIRHNLSLNRCFRKVPRLAQDPLIRGKGSKGGFWAVDMDQLSKTTFGRQILDSGMLNTVWSIHNVQQPMDDFDFQGLVSPLYHSAMETTRSSAYSELLDQERASTAVFLARLSQPLSALSTPSFQQNEGSVTSDSTKTYSLRDVSPESPVAIQTPLLSSMRLHEHKLDLESNDPLLLNPSLMRVNNILN
ncbi:fork head domain-containing protein [Phycomyces blakesleeanus]